MSAFRPLAIILAAIVFFAIGAVWYNVLQAPWLAGIGKSLEQVAREQGNSPLPYAVGFAGILVMCATLGWLIARLDATTVAAGMRTGAIVAIGFLAAQLALNYGFESRPAALWLINAGYALIGLVAAGGIIGGWRRRR